MRLRSLLPVAVGLALAWTSAAHAQGFWDSRARHGGQVSLGAGFIGASVSGGGPSVDGASGSGMQILLELRLAERLAWDMRLGGFWAPMGAPAEINYPADDGDFALASMALRYDVFRKEPWAVFAGAEGTLHYDQMQEWVYSVAGWGGGFVLGADVAVAGPFALRASVHWSWASLESSSEARLGTARVVWGGLDLLYVLR